MSCPRSRASALPRPSRPDPHGQTIRPAKNNPWESVERPIPLGMRNTSGLWRGGSPGRPAGTPNRASKEVRAFCQRLIADAEYRRTLETRLRAGTLPPQLESLIWNYAFGRPPQSLDVHRHGPSLAEIIAGVAVDSDETED